VVVSDIRNIKEKIVSAARRKSEPDWRTRETRALPEGNCRGSTE
jgi:hypothetical protein